MSNSLYGSLEGLVPDSIIAIATCLPGGDAVSKLNAALLIGQTGLMRDHVFTDTDTDTWSFPTIPGANGTLAFTCADDTNDATVWTLEYEINGAWEEFDTQPAAGMSDTRIQWPSERARLTPDVVSATPINVLAVA